MTTKIVNYSEALMYWDNFNDELYMRIIRIKNFYEKDIKTGICIYCEYEFAKSKMNEINGDFICNKCFKPLDLKKQQDDK